MKLADARSEAGLLKTAYKSVSSLRFARDGERLAVGVSDAELPWKILKAKLALREASKELGRLFKRAAYLRAELQNVTCAVIGPPHGLDLPPSGSPLAVAKN